MLSFGFSSGKPHTYWLLLQSTIKIYVKNCDKKHFLFCVTFSNLYAKVSFCTAGINQQTHKRLKRRTWTAKVWNVEQVLASLNESDDKDAEALVRDRYRHTHKHTKNIHTYTWAPIGAHIQQIKQTSEDTNSCNDTAN